MLSLSALALAAAIYGLKRSSSSRANQILLLERRRTCPVNGRGRAAPSGVCGDARYQAPETWHSSDGKYFSSRPPLFSWAAIARCMEPFWLRLRRAGLSMRLRHPDGISPSWPLAVRRVRALLHSPPKNFIIVHGLRGEDPTHRASKKPGGVISRLSRMNRVSSNCSMG